MDPGTCGIAQFDLAGHRRLEVDTQLKTRSVSSNHDERRRLRVGVVEGLLGIAL